ncbi:MAG: class I SAM-dependent methyltransferase [Bacteroidota bacterium]
MRQTTAVILRRNWRWRLAQFLEIRWWQRYLRKKPAKAYLADKKAYWQRVLHQLQFSPKPDLQALEVGCGPAGIFLLLHELQMITAVDPLLDKYQQELAHFQAADYPQISFIAEPFESYQLPADKFEVIYCFNAINHVADWEGCLQKISRAAAPGTVLLLSSDVHQRRWLRSIFRALPGDLLHPHQHLAAEYRQELERLGWEIQKEVLLKPGGIFNYLAWRAEMKQSR